MDYMKENLGDKLTTKEYGELREAHFSQDICPLCVFSGLPARLVASPMFGLYNCAYIAPTCPKI